MWVTVCRFVNWHRTEYGSVWPMCARLWESTTANPMGKRKVNRVLRDRPLNDQSINSRTMLPGSIDDPIKRFQELKTRGYVYFDECEDHDG